MINYLWAGLMLIAVFFGLVTNRMDALSSAVLSGGKQAVELFLSLLSVMMFWGGLTEIMNRSGLADSFGKFLAPIIHWLFPGLRLQPMARNAVAMNITANMLGLGNAATPLGLKAMKYLQQNNSSTTIASNDMVTFVVLNSVSVQLIPTTLAMLRAQYNSAQPMSVLLPVWMVSFTAAAFGLALTIALNQRRPGCGANR